MALAFWLFVGFALFLSHLSNKQKKEREKLLTYSPSPVWDAGFAMEKSIEDYGAFKDRAGIIVGSSWEKGKPISYNPRPAQFKTIITFGGMGSGKTTANQIPFALSWGINGKPPGSLILIETTAETAITSLHRRQRYQPVSLINPTGAYREYFRGIPMRKYNSLAPYWLNPRDLSSFGVRAAKVALGQVPDATTREPYFNNTSRHLAKVIDMALVELSPPGRANVGRVAEIIFEDPIHYCRYASTRVQTPKLRAQLMRFARPDSEEIRSVQEVIQNACTHMSAFMEPAFANCFSESQVRFGDARRVPQTICVLLPLESLGANSYLLAFVVEQILAELQSEQFAGDVPVAIQIDELAQYPRMDSVIRASSSLRKYNAFMSICINDFGTLQHIYGKEAADTFINNAGVVQWMSTKDPAGCEALSRMLGETEVHVENKSIGIPLPGAGPQMETVSQSFSQHSRRLMLPFEIAQNLGSREQIVFMDGIARPILCRKRPYYETDLAKIARPNIFRGK